MSGYSDQVYITSKASAKAYLYQGDSTEALAEYTCEVNSTGKGWDIPIYKFDLDPNSSYRIVIPADQFSLWELDDTGRYVEIKDSRNSELVINYTTPSELVMPTRTGVSSTDPAEGSSVSQLTSLRINLSKAVYEEESQPVELWESNLALPVYKNDDTEPVATIAMEIKNDKTDYWLKNSDRNLSVNLVKGNSYRIVLPAGVVSAQTDGLRDILANEEYTINLTGAYVPKLTCSVNGVAAIATPVNPGDQVTVSFPENDGFQLASLSYNGEDQTVADSFTTPAIEDDASLEANYEYKGTIHFDYTTGVDVVDCPFTVTNDGDVVRITGVEGKAITVYAINGMVMGSFEEATQNVVNITLARDQVYIIKIGDQVLKIQH